MSDWAPGRLSKVVQAAAFALVFSALAACASPGPRLVVPKVTVDSISVSAVRGSDATVTLSLRVENPNAIDLILQSLLFTLSVDDMALTNGTTVRGKTIVAGGSAVIEIETHTNINAALQLIALSANRRLPSLQYSLDGEAIVQNGIRLPFARRGDIPLSKAFAPVSPR